MLSFFILLCFFPVFFSSLNAASQSEDYLVEIAKKFYDKGNYQDALHEFNKVLLINPDNTQALKYKKLIEPRMPAQSEILDTSAMDKLNSQLRQKDESLRAVEKEIDEIEDAISEIMDDLEKEKLKRMDEELNKAENKLEPTQMQMEKSSQGLSEKKIQDKKEVKQQEPKSLEQKSKKAKPKDYKAEDSSLKKPEPKALPPIPPQEESVKAEEKIEPEKEGLFIDKLTSKLKPENLPFNVTGEARASLGFSSEDTYWKRANADLNERNWRIMSGTAMNNYENTYDPGIYDRVRFNIDTENNSGLNMHTNFTVDPWSFTGKSNRITVGAGTDAAEFEVLYWSNSNFTVNQSIFTLNNGDVFNLPEMKVEDGETDPVSVKSLYNNTFNIPELDIHKTFWPIREFWLDYMTDDEAFNTRFFPMAYQDQALTSDDPLGLSNHHIWWEESPWLARWKPGNFNENDADDDDFTKGQWDDSLAFITRDSDGNRLTALRGLSLGYNPFDNVSFTGTFASPKTLWQDYDSFDTYPGAMQLKYLLSDNVSLGSLFTYHFGVREGDRDASNYVTAVDSGIHFLPGLNMVNELATSWSYQDETTSYKTEQRGLAYYLTLMADNTGSDELVNNYYSIKPKKGDDFFMKGKLLLARMDKGFDPSLANFRETRDDQFWSRHLHFRKPFEYYYTGLYQPSTTWDDIEPFRLGDGVDTGRYVFGLRTEVSLFDGILEGLGDIRNVHYANNKYLETVSRTEWTYKVTPKLTSKLLLLNHDLPKTKGGIDPFIVDPDLNTFVINDQIPDGEDPSLNTGSVGFEYRFNDFVALNGIYERSNDTSLAYDNFPRGILGGADFATFTAQTFQQENMLFRQLAPFLYDQEHFPLPPYPYFDIFKAGLQIDPTDKLSMYLDWTRNEFESAGQIDDNMNHIGVEASYMPAKKLGLIFKYVYSFADNLVAINQDQTNQEKNHHNFYTGAKYQFSDSDQLMLEYGVGGFSPIGYSSTDPFGGSQPVLDTQHIVRVYYMKKF